MRPLFFFVLFSLSLSAFAQVRREAPFNVSTLSSQDSSVQLESKVLLKPETRWVWVQISKGSTNSDSFFQTFGRPDFSNKIWLRHGPGNYKIRVMVSNAEDQYASYIVADEFVVENTDPRENVDSIAPTLEIQSEAPAIVDLAESIVHGLTTDMEKVAAIHEWVASNISYDVESYMDGSYAVKKWDAVSMLETKKAVCAGYSNLTAALNRAIGLPSKVVLGEGLARGQSWTGIMNHAWNETLVDGKWIIQDTTWDAGYIDLHKRSFTFKRSRKYFNPTPEAFALDHRAQTLQ